MPHKTQFCQISCFFDFQKFCRNGSQTILSKLLFFSVVKNSAESVMLLKTQFCQISCFSTLKSSAELYFRHKFEMAPIRLNLEVKLLIFSGVKDSAESVMPPKSYFAKLLVFWTTKKFLELYFRVPTQIFSNHQVFRSIKS